MSCCHCRAHQGYIWSPSDNQIISPTRSRKSVFSQLWVTRKDNCLEPAYIRKLIFHRAIRLIKLCCADLLSSNSSLSAVCNCGRDMLMQISCKVSNASLVGAETSAGGALDSTSKHRCSLRVSPRKERKHGALALHCARLKSKTPIPRPSATPDCDPHSASSADKFPPARCENLCGRILMCAAW